MKMSEYIAKLDKLLTEHGDLDVVDTYDNEPDEPEEVEGAFVLYDGKEA